MISQPPPETNVNIAGVTGKKPYTYVDDDGNYTGYDFEVLKLIAEKLEQYEVSLSRIARHESFSLPRFASMIRIIVPQAAVSAVPNLANSSVDILKNTSLLYTISVMDIMAKAAVTASIGFRYLEVYTDALIIYLILCIFYMVFFWIIEKFVVGRTAKLMP